MKLLHIAYEKSECSQPKSPFEDLVDGSLLDNVLVFSFLNDWLKHQSAETTKNTVIELIKNHQPDILFWQHIATLPVDDEFFKRLRIIQPKMIIVYHEGDPYGKYIKRITESMSCIIRNADLVFWEGLGSLREFAIKHGAKRVYFSPSMFGLDKFSENWEPTIKREFDVTMIANSGKTKIPFRYLPGGRNREKCVSELCKSFGRQFALYGRGWKKNASYKGPLPFIEQHKAIRNSWISVNWDHFDNINFYNSNRLAISMAAGVPHITTYHKGFEYLYKNVPGGLYFAHSPKEVVDIACYLLSKPVDELIEEGVKAKDYAFKHLQSTEVYKRIIKKIKEHIEINQYAVD